MLANQSNDSSNAAYLVLTVVGRKEEGLEALEIETT